MSDATEREQAESLIERILARGQIVANAGQPPGWWCLAREPELDYLAVAVSRLAERADAYEAVVSDLRKAEDNEVRLALRVQELTLALEAIRDLPSERDLLFNAEAKALHYIAREALVPPRP